MRETILGHLAMIVAEHSTLPAPDAISDDTRLEDFWLDSIGYTTLFSAIEADVGFIPEEILRGAAFPQTVGDVVKMYEEDAQNKRAR